MTDRPRRTLRDLEYVLPSAEYGSNIATRVRVRSPGSPDDGLMGTVARQEGDRWVVRFTRRFESRTAVFEADELEPVG